MDEIQSIKKWIRGNIDGYESFEEYEFFNGMNLEEFEERQARGFIHEITCGTYNGATDTFTPWEINTDNLIDTILQDIRDCDCYEVLDDYTDDNTPLGYAIAYTEMYRVFTIGDNVYIAID